MTTRSAPTWAPGRRSLGLLAGDIVVFLVFATIGRRSHNEAAGLAAIGEVALTAAPFLLGWLATAPLLGAFGPQTARGPLAMLRLTLISWVAALAVGSLIRAAMIGRFSPISFYVVTFLAVLLLLGGWRAAFAWVESRRR
jgi:hypothetical protein